MMDVIVKMNAAIHEFLFKGDVQKKTLIQTPIPLTIVVLYVLFVKWIGPAIMKNRKPFELKYAMIIYDFAQVLVNGYLTYTIFKFVRDTWHVRCMVKSNPLLPFYLQKILLIGWHVFLVKMADLVDTCFFVLRKKDNQISFLHVFHHALMVIALGWGIKEVHSNAMGFYLGFGFSINTTVHCIVYFYYGLAAFGPHMNKYLWWKKYLTQFQMVQFSVILCYMFYGFWTGCEDTGFYEIFAVIYLVVVFVLFIDFYKKYKEE